MLRAQNTIACVHAGILGRDTALRQRRLTDKTEDEGNGPKKTLSLPERPAVTIDFDIRDFKGTQFWDVLVESVKRNPLFANISGYAKTKVLPKAPNISVRELASKLSISIGEAMVILDDFRST
ncbi:MAG: hypothetical protein JSW61_04950 [Candidatus Thorarchaeota archaeon]|nr:MAG: hypothetical protein JSW61_04950 [Candidatus Thorarchaeota archaeon]